MICMYRPDERYMKLLNIKCLANSMIIQEADVEYNIRKEKLCVTLLYSLIKRDVLYMEPGK